MKYLLAFAVSFIFISTTFCQINSLPSEYENEDICLEASRNWSLDVTTAEENLEKIYSKLNFSEYRIEVVKCDRIHTSALACRHEGKRYILINEDRLQNLNYQYFAHLFVIAHEFAHHALKHFESGMIPSNENKRKCELAADEYAASIVKKTGGSVQDCYYALDQMKHPLNPLNSDHPSKEDRINAVDRGFNTDVDINNGGENHNYVDYFSSLSNYSLLKYDDQVSSTDVSEFFNKYNMVPKSIMYFQNSYWIYWKKTPSNVERYKIMWNYDEFPLQIIQEYFDKKYNIVFLEKMNNKWFVVMLKYENQFSQKTLELTKSEFKNKYGAYWDLEKKLNDSYSIQNIVEKDPYTFTFLLKLSSGTGWSWGIFNTYDQFSDWVDKKSNNGLNYLSFFKYIDGKYYSFMRDRESIKTTAVISFDGNDVSEILDRLNNGYSIDNIVVDNSYIRFTVIK
ncbi:MAG: hypothetical protein QM737_13990 [Ferruginibacter sp.]